MKIFCFTLSFILASLLSFSQSNFYRFSVGAGAGAGLAFADLKNQTFTFAANGVLDYNITPYFSLGLEVQKGELAGGDIQIESTHRQFINSYLAGSANIRLQLGAFMDRYDLRSSFWNAVRGAYAGIGVGFIKNKVSNVRYYGDSYYPGEDDATDMVIPVNFGINFYIPDQWGYSRFVINGNIQAAMTNGEGIDGYHNPNSKASDFYGFYSVGFRYNFGPMGLDRRR